MADGEGGPVGPRTVGDVIGERLLGMLEAQEEALDAKMRALDDMGEDDIERLRQARLDQMKKLAKQKGEWAAAGHGEYREIDDQKRFFEELKTSARCVVHFYRPSTRRCEIIDKHFYALARKHMETKFVRVNAEKAPFLTERLHIWMLPTIVCCVNGRTDHSIMCAGRARRAGGAAAAAAALPQSRVNPRDARRRALTSSPLPTRAQRL